MNPALRDDPSALRVNVTIPTTSVRLGPFQFDGQGEPEGRLPVKRRDVERELIEHRIGDFSCSDLRGFAWIGYLCHCLPPRV